MAFRELTENELSFLSEAQKKQYEKELRLYKERVEFVEQLQRIEKSNYKYEKPKFKRINPVRRLELPKYSNDGKIKVVLDEGFSRKKSLASSNEKADASRKLRSRLLKKAPINAVPSVNVILPQVEEIELNDKFEIKNVTENKNKVNIPKIQSRRFGQPAIKNIPEKAGTVIPDVKYEYEKKPVRVTPVKVKLPEKTKTIGINAVSINNIPNVSLNKIESREFNFAYDKNAASMSVKEKASFIKPQLPKASFEPVKAEIGRIEVPEPIKTDFSAVESRIDKNFKASVKLDDTAKLMPSIPAINEYKQPMLNVEIPSVNIIGCPEYSQAAEIKVPEIADIAPQKINLPQLDAGKFEIPDIAKVNVSVPEKTELPKCETVRFEAAELSEIPEIKTAALNYNDEDVECLKIRIQKAMQGV